jgi:N-acetylmuramic acid 6-phosphate etherase
LHEKWNLIRNGSTRYYALKKRSPREYSMTMATNSQPSAGRKFLGIEGGGTRTVALLADERGRLLGRREAGPANLKLLGDLQLTRLLQTFAGALPAPDSLAIGLAGARTEADFRRIRKAAEKIWPAIPCLATNDLETALAAAQGISDAQTRVLILSGTGSCCFGRNATGRSVKVGGWGHLLGDRGSGYEIGLRALKAVAAYCDQHGAWPGLGRRILQQLLLNGPDELIAWAQAVGKPEIAGLATHVFAAWKRGDRLAARIIAGAEESLAQDAVQCAQQLAGRVKPVPFILAGGILLKQPQFARQLGVRLRKLWPGAVVAPLERESAWGAVALAQNNFGSFTHVPIRSGMGKNKSSPNADFGNRLFPQSTRLSPTEQRNPRSRHLDKLPPARAIKLMLSEDAKIPAAILAERKKIELALRLVIQAFRRGGRLFYVGAGTSGRLGVLDASECPPTFRTPPEQVQGIIAGGQTALWRSVEGAEDDAGAGGRAIVLREVGRRDVVLGIAASGRTPFVWGALGQARRRGAKTILLSFNPFIKIPAPRRPDLVITPNVGPEVLTGSTRLKAGTATKLILNILTTLAMARTGRVSGNLMVDLNASNEKLRGRATRMVRELCGVDEHTARRALEDSGWAVKRACAKLSRKGRAAK